MISEIDSFRRVLRPWYAPLVGSRFSFTDEALANLRVYDVTPGEVWEALHSPRRVIRHLGDDVMVVYAAARHGRRLAVLLAEADGADNDWDVLSARELTDAEAKRYDEAVRRFPDDDAGRRFRR
ncbi:hypothetical protein GA0070558_10674 [Micromonospora haikouensis]|uniref:BrnT family toxin n=1 Tax=Micromonospora haikouensis TaxID=686309 RepID=A0A1C4V1W5_9ACTN|nr:hypothetical protein GA0070558_10674 [Micromonospora haikouensis]